MKTIHVVVVLIAVALTAGLSTAATAATAGSLADIVERGELRVAVQSGAAPMAFVDKKGEHTGAMVDFGKDMAKRMGVKLKILKFDWKDLIPALLSGKADILAADMTATLERALKVTFTDPWYYSQLCIFTKTNILAPYETLADVDRRGVTVGVLQGSTGESMAQKILKNAQIRSLKGDRMIIQALLDGQIDAGINDDLAVLTALPDYPPNSVRLLDKRLGSRAPLCFAVRQESVNLWQCGSTSILQPRDWTAPTTVSSATGWKPPSGSGLTSRRRRRGLGS